MYVVYISKYININIQIYIYICIHLMVHFQSEYVQWVFMWYTHMFLDIKKWICIHNIYKYSQNYMSWHICDSECVYIYIYVVCIYIYNLNYIPSYPPLEWIVGSRKKQRANPFPPVVTQSPTWSPALLSRPRTSWSPELWINHDKPSLNVDRFPGRGYHGCDSTYPITYCGYVQKKNTWFRVIK